MRMQLKYWETLEEQVHGHSTGPHLKAGAVCVCALHCMLSAWGEREHDGQERRFPQTRFSLQKRLGMISARKNVVTASGNSCEGSEG